MKKSLNVFVVSDATGTTAESVLTSVKVQYKGTKFLVRRFPFTKTVKEIDAILSQALEEKGIIIFTLVSGKLRDHLLRKTRRKRLILIDVMGPLIKVFSERLHHVPRMKAGVFKRPDQEILRTAEAIDFTMQHDDGQGLDTLDEADLIIFGVSRSGKTPASIYLSCRNVKVANIPIVMGIPVPREIIRLPVKKVGFLIDLDRLVQLRSQRLRYMPYAERRGYSSKAAVLEELDYCERVFRTIPLLETIDITYRSIEETAEWITHHVL